MWYYKDRKTEKWKDTNRLTAFLRIHQLSRAASRNLSSRSPRLLPRQDIAFSNMEAPSRAPCEGADPGASPGWWQDAGYSSDTTAAVLRLRCCRLRPAPPRLPMQLTTNTPHLCSSRELFRD